MEFFNGKLVNNYKAYYYNGTLEQEMKFVNGSYNGKIIEYHSNGKVKTEKIICTTICMASAKLTTRMVS